MRKKMTSILVLLIVFVSACTAVPQPGSEQNPEADPKSSEEAPALTEGVQEVAGKVVSGGDTTAEGLQDGPRTYVYQVGLNGGGTVEVSYVALPPGPAADRQLFTLEFHAGQIQVGDYIEIRGLYDLETNRITVSEEGDYIKTYAEQP
jgi:hypothetical protein